MQTHYCRAGAIDAAGLKHYIMRTRHKIEATSNLQEFFYQIRNKTRQRIYTLITKSLMGTSDNCAIIDTCIPEVQ